MKELKALLLLADRQVCWAPAAATLWLDPMVMGSARAKPLLGRDCCLSPLKTQMLTYHECNKQMQCILAFQFYQGKIQFMLVLKYSINACYLPERVRKCFEQFSKYARHYHQKKPAFTLASFLDQ